MNNQLIELTISDLGEIVTGNTPPTNERKLYGGKFPLIMPTDMVEGEKYIGETAETLSEDGFKKYRKNILPTNTPCVVTIGSIGKKLCMTKEPSFTNQAVNAIKVYTDKFNPTFIYYLLKYNLPRVKYLSNGTASGRENVSKSSFSKIKIILPKHLSAQSKIASILTSYDELIENNNQRIKLLEETAEEIYKEWFVRMRFPGYESTSFFNAEGKQVAHGTLGALAQGWEKVRLTDVYITSSGGTPLREKVEYYLDGNINWLKTKELQDSFIFSTEEKITEIGLKKSSAKIFPKDTVLIGMYGGVHGEGRKSTLGQLGILHEPACTNQACCAFIPRNKKTYSYPYLFLFLKSKRIDLLNLSMGAAQQNISQEIIQNSGYINPMPQIIEHFDKIAREIFDGIKVLSQKNILLQETRDLLLPRLISGKLGVEHLLEEEEKLTMAAEPELAYGKN